VHRSTGYADHRDRDDDPVEVQYADAHDVVIEPAACSRDCSAPRDRRELAARPGVNRLAPRLRVEARRPTAGRGVLGADAPGFAARVQWHPEWHAADNPVSMRLLGAFGDAARAYREAARSARLASEEARHAPA
jgi:putative glutamine amidotransferase